MNTTALIETMGINNLAPLTSGLTALTKTKAAFECNSTTGLFGVLPYPFLDVRL